MKKTIIVIAVVFFMLTNFSYIFNTSVSSEEINDDIVINYVFDNLQLEKISIGGNEYTEITIDSDDSFSYTSIPGEPRIPVKGCKIAIPYGKKVESVHVTKNDPVTFSVDFKIEPSQDVIPIGYDGEISFDMPKEEIYNSDEIYPSIDCEIVTEQRFRGYNFLVLNLFPVEYRPLTNKLNFYKSLELTIKTSTFSNLENIDLNYRGLEKDKERFKKIIDNPQLVDGKSYPSNQFPTDEVYEYVIITTENLKNYNQGGYNLHDLADAKTNVGLNTKIMTVEEIGNGYSGTSTQEKIRNFIKYAYNNWQTDYVLIAGDTGLVPTKNVYVQDPKWPKNVPCDLYYACLDSDAPDGSYECDLTAEVYVGRAPVDNTQEVTNFVKKTLDYMDTNDDYIYSALWIAEDIQRGIGHGKELIKQSIGHCEDDGYITNGLPEGNGEYEYDLERLWVGYCPQGYANSKLSSGNYHLINYIGHSNTNLCIGMSSSTAKNLGNDNYFFLYAQSCLAGNFAASDCFAEYITVKNSKGGAFATITNSGYGWQYKGQRDGPNNRFHREFWDAIFGEQTPIYGQAFHDAKEDNLVNLFKDYFLFTYYTVVFLGDPSLNVRGTRPTLLYSPHSYDFGQMEKGETDATTFKIWNLGSEEMTYTLSEDCDWVSVSPTQGSSSSGKRNTITVTIDTSKVSDGEHTCSVDIESDIGPGVFIISVKVGAILAFNPTYYRNCLPKQEQTFSSFKIWNDGLDTLHYTLNFDADWLTVTPTEGESTGELDAIVFMIDTNGLENGWHKCSISINSSAGGDIFDVMVGVEGPDEPMNVAPKHNASGLETDVTLSVMVKDSDEDVMSVGFYNALDDSEIGFVENVKSGDTASINWNNLEYGVTYRWYATANDSIMESKSDIFCFTTNSPPIFSNEHPEHGSVDVSISGKLSLDIVDLDGDSFDWIITTNPDIGSSNGEGLSETSVQCDITGLMPNNEYIWTVEASDGKSGTNKVVYSFKTKENTAPEKPNIVSPVNNAVEIDINNYLNWACVDPDSDNLVYDVYFGKNPNPPLIFEGVTENRYKIPSDSDINTVYYWKIVAYDSYGVSSEGDVWNFKTSSAPPPIEKVRISFSNRLVWGGVKASIQNIGKQDASNVKWSVSVTGGLFDKVNISKSGCFNLLNLSEIQDISTYEFLNINSNVFGIGRVKVIVKVTNIDDEMVGIKSSEAILIGPFLIFIG